MGQDVGAPSSISTYEYELEAVSEFAYLGSTITDSFSLETELNRRIGKAATTLSTLTKRVWTNSNLIESTRKYRCARLVWLSTLLYGRESWTLLYRQERRLNSIHNYALLDASLASRGEKR